MTSESALTSLNSWFEDLIRAGTASVETCPAEFRQSLEGYGVQIDADTAVLSERFSPLAAGTILAGTMASRSIPWKISCLPVTASTNTVLMEAAALESISYSVVTADLQVSGRGRRGRQWLSPVGYGLSISVGFEPQIAAHKLMGLSLVIGVSVAKTLSALGVTGATLKWPNDVLLNGAKLVGILVEVASTDPLRVVIGIGINVGTESLSSPQVDQATADLASYPELTRSRLASNLLGILGQDLQVFEAEGFKAFRNAWEALHEYQGKPVTLHQADQTIDGVVRGVGLQGQLELATPDGLREFVAGEVSLRPVRG